MRLERLPPNLEQRPAYFSRDRLHRYWLMRALTKFGSEYCPLLWIMLNPSIANERRDDPTTRLTMNLGRRWGHSHHMAVNLFALVDTYPEGILRSSDPVGYLNDHVITRAVKHVMEHGGGVMVAWGTHGHIMDRQNVVLNLLDSLGAEPYCLGTTKDGYPKFPRAIKRSTVPVPFPI